MNRKNANPDMERMLAGIVRFHRDVQSKDQTLYQPLDLSQAPHTLFITCSDSRVDPQRITGCQPGELFIIRNIANMIPIYIPLEELNQMLDQLPSRPGLGSTAAAVEYAVKGL